MNLQELIGELLTLSQAYPPETIVAIQTVDFKHNISAVEVESLPTGVEITLRVQ
jgi:hypothetical protein